MVPLGPVDMRCGGVLRGGGRAVLTLGGGHEDWQTQDANGVETIARGHSVTGPTRVLRRAG
jgi:hypothetical protein